MTYDGVQVWQSGEVRLCLKRVTSTYLVYFSLDKKFRSSAMITSTFSSENGKFDLYMSLPIFFFFKDALSPGYGLGTLVKNKLDKNVMIKKKMIPSSVSQIFNEQPCQNYQ